MPRVGRRPLLVSLALGPAWLLRWAAAARSPGRGRTGLSRADRCLARLGGRVAAVAPAVAEDLVREVEREVGSATRGPGGDPARLARETFLPPVRLRRDFDRGDVLVVDGWVLSRSEVAVCVYLYALATHAMPRA